jgi:hypothetical protein
MNVCFRIETEESEAFYLVLYHTVEAVLQRNCNSVSPPHPSLNGSLKYDGY